MYMYLEAYKVPENDFKKPQEIKGRSCIKNIDKCVGHFAKFSDFNIYLNSTS